MANFQNCACEHDFVLLGSMCCVSVLLKKPEISRKKIPEKDPKKIPFEDPSFGCHFFTALLPFHAA